MAKKYLDSDGVLYFWQKIKAYFVTDVSYDSSSKKIQKTKSGSTSDVVTLATVATSGSYSDLSNKPTIPEGVEKTSTTPKMDGTAAIGSETKFAAGDHVHPTDTSRVPTSRTVNGKALTSDIALSASDVSALPSSTSIPSKTSDLTNDSGYITGYTETDPTVPSWAKAASKPSYTANEVGYGSSNVQSALDDLYTLKVLVISVASFSSLPQTVSNASITADHICLKAELGTPSAQTGDWTVTTSAGSVTISGSISGSTTATLYLARKEN